MNVTETLSQGLKREFQVVLNAADLKTRLDDELQNLQGKARINGFRPGKVPVGHLRRLYGRSVMADVVQNAVNEANQKIVSDNGLKLAFEPQIKFPENKDEIEAAMEAKGDLAFTVALEVLPKIELADLSDVALVKPVAEIPEADVDAALERMASQNRPFSSKGDDAVAGKGDRLLISFTGTLDGEPFDGGTGTGIPLDLGSGQFIPGFEDQLEGAKKGESRTVSVTFPENYTATHLAGKPAEFAVTVDDVQAPGELTIDDELAKGFGMESLDALKAAIREQLGRELGTQSRRKLKKSLLDALDTKYAFELPPTLVDQEFGAVWSQVEADMKQANKTFADEDTTEEDARAEYRKIAERRVRLGLVLAEIGEQAKIQIADDEVTQALIERARQFPGQEKEVWEFYRKNPQALAEIRAPIFEEKVVDHLLGQVKVEDKTVSREELFADDEEESEAKAKPAKAKKAKKAAASDEASA
ncbi:trigger factor [Bosea sp. (in: a-proteobacteria)]|jgi:trigger factor|uniref:trigger factor n=1 Tax=Bosea sp. (in: a-proteobacteria) TaxID=1871050 RepID=UPI00086C1E37|nr:trigger factor [Bosea sp. (in: a-proteobacteria)]MBN9439188.1 trigger factor [Bosea sp. (in: a-proteobacteria)]ODT46707.1 MAG: trigger factor [Methylobacterium sp. SCN 67-24]